MGQRSAPIHAAEVPISTLHSECAGPLQFEYCYLSRLNYTVRPPLDIVKHQVRAALEEDIGSGDLTANLVPENRMAHARVIAREPAVLCGCPWFAEVMHHLDASIAIEWRFNDGDDLDVNDVVCSLRGPARQVLSGERTALNFLQLLSGTASVAKVYVSAIEGTGARILDTRKTIPGLRQAQKYAVRCGGAENHRFGLFDAILIKENHILAAGSIASAVTKAKQASCPVEVEVETLDELRQAIAGGADRALLDNFSMDDLRRAVALNDKRLELEASGNVSMEIVREIAETGVDYISVGALTKNVKAIDFSMRFE